MSNFVTVTSYFLVIVTFIGTVTSYFSDDVTVTGYKNYVTTVLQHCIRELVRNNVQVKYSSLDVT